MCEYCCNDLMSTCFSFNKYMSNMGLNEVAILDDTFQASAKSHTAFGATMTLIYTSDRYHDRSYLSKNNWLAKMKKKYSDCTGVGVHGLQCNDNCKIKNNVNV